MPVIKFALVFVLLFGLGFPTGAEAATQSRESRVELARRVEERAAATSFPALEAFGEAAMTVPGREGLNRLYHVMWITLNQGDFERAEVWNNRLAAAALERRDQRYQMIARLNALSIRYDSGDMAASVEIDQIGLRPLKWSIPYVGLRTRMDGAEHGQEASQARRDHRQAASG